VKRAYSSIHRLLGIVLCSLFLSTPLHAAFILKNGKFYKEEELATRSPQEHYSRALDAYHKKMWEDLRRESCILRENFPQTPFVEDVDFFLGMAFFYLGDCEYANRHFTRYLQKQTAAKYFEQAIEHKFKIAQKFHKGAKKHLFGWKAMPQWVPAKDDALTIYDEVVAALPRHELSTSALFDKATLLFEKENYKESVQTFQTLIRRFPKHHLAAEAYLAIGKVYLRQCEREFPDPDFLDLAEINLRNFSQNFPQEERLHRVQKDLLAMKEIYAASLYEVGKFYQRTDKPAAAAIYFRRVLDSYPESSIASLSQKRLLALDPKAVPTLAVPSNSHASAPISFQESPASESESQQDAATP